MKWRATFSALEYNEWTGELIGTDRKNVREIYADSYDSAVIKANATKVTTEGQLMFIEFVNDLTEAEERAVEMMKRFEALGF